MGLQGFEMTQSFDEWNKETDSLCPRRAYEAGAASRQAEIDNLKQSHHGASIGRDVFIKQLKERHKAEIDELQLKLKSTKQSADEVIGAMSISIHKRNKENESLNQVVDELQKRVDEALRELMVYKNNQTAIIALKGKQDEK